MSPFAYLLYFVWLALWFESIRYDVFYPEPPKTVYHWKELP